MPSQGAEISDIMLDTFVTMPKVCRSITRSTSACLQLGKELAAAESPAPEVPTRFALLPRWLSRPLPAALLREIPHSHFKSLINCWANA